MKAMLLVLPLLALAACATTSDGSGDKAKTYQARKMVRTSDCMFSSSINGFRALDDRYMILYGPGRNNAYLAELTPGCFQIQNTTMLGTVDADNNGQICGYGRDGLAYREFGRTESCRIMSLEKLSELRYYEVTGEGPATPKGKDRKKDKDKDEEEDKPKEDDDGE